MTVLTGDVMSWAGTPLVKCIVSPALLCEEQSWSPRVNNFVAAHPPPTAPLLLLGVSVWQGPAHCCPSPSNSQPASPPHLLPGRAHVPVVLQRRRTEEGQEEETEEGSLEKREPFQSSLLQSLLATWDGHSPTSP